MDVDRIPVHRMTNGKLSGFIGFMPAVPRKGDVLVLGGDSYRVKLVAWVFDQIPRAWEARLELELY